MADELDDIFAVPLEAQEPVPDTAADPVPEPVAEAVTPEPVTPEVQTAPEEPRNGFVPIAAMMDERDQKKEERAKRIAAEERLAELERSRQPQSIPDPYDDPEGNTAYLQGQLSEALQKQKMELSHYWAVDKHGKDNVEAARTWALEKAQTDPGFRAKLEAEMPMQAMPFEWVVQQHKRDGLISQLPTDVTSLDELIEREIAKRSQSAPAPAAQAVIPQQASPPVKVPRSLASQGSAPSDLRHTATGALSGVDALFN